MNFLQKLFGLTPKESKDNAKKRLQLVLMSDRTDITPELMNALRRDMVEVITRYMDVDENNIELLMDRDEEGGQVALEVSIPVLRLRRGTQVAQSETPKATKPSSGSKTAAKGKVKK